MALSQRQELELLMLEKEKRRRESTIRSKEVHRDIGERAGKTFSVPNVEDTARLAAQGATFGFADEIAGKWAQFSKSKGDNRPEEEIYESARNEFRDETKMARDRSPFFGFAVENLAGIAPSVVMGGLPVIGKMMKSQGLFSTAVESAAIGVGESERSPKTSGGISAAVGVGSQILGRLAKAPFKSPSKIRARATGAKKEQFKHRGLYRDPERTAKELKGVNFWSRGPREFDLEQMKFIKNRKGTQISSESALEDLQFRAEKADNQIWKRKQEIINNNALKEKYLHTDLIGDERLLDSFDNYITNSRDKKLAAKHIDQIESELEESISRPMNFENDIDGVVESVTELQGSSLMDVEKAKQIYQQAASRIYKKSTNEGEIAKADLYDSVAKYLKQFVEENTGRKSAEFGKLNKISSRFKLIKDDLQGEIAERSARGTSVTPAFSVPYAAVKAGEQVGISPSGALTRANIGDVMESGFGEAIQSGVRQSPTRLFERMVEPSRSGREPQSLPEKLVRVKFPRNTDAVNENKDLILAKIAQQAPQMFDLVREVLENRPEDIGEVMASVTQLAPGLFKKDKYNRFDGIILNPEMKSLARIDTMKSDDLSNTEKIEILDKLNKTGEFPL